MEPTTRPGEERPEKPAEEAGEPALGAGFDFADPNSPLAGLYLRSGHVFAAVALTAVFTLLTLVLRVWHTDVWGHLRFGESIVKERKLPEREMFSGDFADQDAEYINYQWIAQAGAYLVFDLGRHLAGENATADAQLGGGALMLSTVHAAVVTLRLLVLLFVFRRLTSSFRAGLLGIVLVLGMSVPCHLFILRPQILGEFAFAILLLPLSRPILSRRALVLIPVLFVVWANTHGSFLMGFVLLGIFVAGRGLQVGRENGLVLGPLWRDAQLRRLIGVLTAALAAVAVLNPHGPAMFLHIVRLSQHPNIAFLEEWKPLPLQTVPGYTYLASALGWKISPTFPPPSPMPGYIFLASGLILVMLLRWSPTPWFTATQILLIVAFGWQTLAHARVFVWWTTVLPWVIVPHLYALFRRWDVFSQEEKDQLNLRKTILAAMAVVALLMWSRTAHWLVFGDTPAGARLVGESTPLKAVAYLKKQYAANPNLPRCVFTSETVGEYLLWDLRLDPPVRVFCYTHVHLMTEQHWQECLRVKNGDPGWQEILDRNKVAFLIVEADLHVMLAKQVRAAADRWDIVPDTAPLLIARRKLLPGKEP